jgi:hypothetical protein
MRRPSAGVQHVMFQACADKPRGAGSATPAQSTGDAGVDERGQRAGDWFAPTLAELVPEVEEVHEEAVMVPSSLAWSWVRSRTTES